MPVFNLNVQLAYKVVPLKVLVVPVNVLDALSNAILLVSDRSVEANCDQLGIEEVIFSDTYSR